MWGKPSNIHTLDFQFLIYIENIEEKCWDSFVILSFGIPDEPPCYVRQCSTSSNSLFNRLVKGLVHMYIISDMSRGKLLHMYTCI